MKPVYFPNLVYTHEIILRTEILIILIFTFLFAVNSKDANPSITREKGSYVGLVCLFCFAFFKKSIIFI